MRKHGDDEGLQLLGFACGRITPHPSHACGAGPSPLPLGEVLRGAYSAAFTVRTSASTSSVCLPIFGGSRRMLTGDLEKRRPGFMAR